MLLSVLKISVRAMFYILHQARAHGDTELFQDSESETHI
jgi:hypothetical protein